MKLRRFIAAAVILCAALLILSWIAGTLLTSPVRRPAGRIPEDLTGRAIEFPSESGSVIQGWLLQGQAGKGTIALMHGVRASRVDMLGRARFLNRAGYSVLLFDFQAHGESAGDHITFGHLESRDARAAVQFARTQLPQEKIGVIGVSMGGAAAMLAEPPLTPDAIVLEQVYPTLHQAIADRISMRLGSWSKALSPLLSWQIRPRLGVSPEALRPLDRAARISAPKLFIGGAADLHTTSAELRALFDAAAEPKELWIVPEARHVDLCRFGKDEYEQRILGFFSRHLRPAK